MHRIETRVTGGSSDSVIALAHLRQAVKVEETFSRTTAGRMGISWRKIGADGLDVVVRTQILNAKFSPLRFRKISLDFQRVHQIHVKQALPLRGPRGANNSLPLQTRRSTAQHQAINCNPLWRASVVRALPSNNLDASVQGIHTRRTVHASIATEALGTAALPIATTVPRAARVPSTLGLRLAGIRRGANCAFAAR